MIFLALSFLVSTATQAQEILSAPPQICEIENSATIYRGDQFFQDDLGKCLGVLIGPSTLLTAGHCTSRELILELESKLAKRKDLRLTATRTMITCYQDGKKITSRMMRERAYFEGLFMTAFATWLVSDDRNPESVPYDLAVMELENKMPFTPMRVVKSTAMERCFTSHGRQIPGQKGPPFLRRYADVPEADKYSYINIPAGLIDGDSGGPLICDQGGGDLVVAGINSMGVFAGKGSYIQSITARGFDWIHRR